MPKILLVVTSAKNMGEMATGEKATGSLTHDWPLRASFLRPIFAVFARRDALGNNCSVLLPVAHAAMGVMNSWRLWWKLHEI